MQSIVQAASKECIIFVVSCHSSNNDRSSNILDNSEEQLIKIEAYAINYIHPSSTSIDLNYTTLGL